MAILTIRLADDKHDRLKQLAKSRAISINKLIEEFSTMAILEFDTYNRFQLMASKNNPSLGLKLLDKIDSMDN